MAVCGGHSPGLLRGHPPMACLMPSCVLLQSCMSWCWEGLWGFLSVRI